MSTICIMESAMILTKAFRACWIFYFYFFLWMFVVLCVSCVSHLLHNTWLFLLANCQCVILVCMHLFIFRFGLLLMLNLFIYILKVNCQYIMNTHHQWTSDVLVIYLSTHTWIEFDGLFTKHMNISKPSQPIAFWWKRLIYY